ncbi:MAG: hypothetical protein RMK29_18770 [Myxococcales bacterium]|nr:hypothetical protein [Myxococcales bacterium]
MDDLPTEAQRYRCLDTVAFPAGAEGALVYADFSRQRALLPHRLLGLLERCRPFRTLAEHADALAGPGEDREAVLCALQQLCAQGLLVSEQDLRERLAQARQPPPPPIEAVGIVTRDRLPSLLACLHSLLDNLATAGRHPEIVIMDDSPGPRARERTLAALKDLSRTRGVRLRYAGPPEKEAYAARLAQRAGLPEAVARFALRDDRGLSRACGANHNALLLDQVGRLFLSLDDDVLCRPVRLSHPQHDLRFTSVSDPTQFAFFRNPSETHARTRDIELDVLGDHERLLGRGLGDLLDATGPCGRIDLSTLEDSFVRALTPTARVRLTLHGLCGDSGMGSPAAYLALRGDSRARLLRSEQDYRAYCTSRQVLRGVSCPTVTDSAFLMAPVLGHDARDLLPPYFPVLRNNDGIFGAAVRLTLPDAYVGHLPYALRHEPPEPRAFPPDALWSGAGQVHIFEVVLCCMASLRPPVRTPGLRLQALGQRLCDLGALSLPAFEAELAPMLLRLVGQRAEQLEACLRDHGGEPAWWAADVQRHLDRLRHRAVAPDFLVPVDLHPHPPEQARQLGRDLVRCYGELLLGWPALWAAAQALRAEGIRPSCPLDQV